MSHGVLHYLEGEAARWGFHKHNTFNGGVRKVSWTVKCSKCPHEFSAYWPANTSTELMAKNMRIRNWSVGKGERPLCPQCAHPKADKHPEEPPKNLIDHYAPPPTAITDALVKAAKAKIPSLTTEEVARIELAIAHVQNVREADVGDKAALLNGASVREIGLSTPDRKLFTHGELKPPADIAPPKRKMDVSNRRPRGPDKKPRKRAKRETDYAHEFDDRQFKPYPEAPPPIATTEKDDQMNATAPTPKPKIAHAVFQTLDSVFDPDARLYKNGYTDQRVAADCGTSEDVVAYLRKETFGDLAEDPRITGLREDLELARMEMTDLLKKMNALYDALKSRVDQIAMTTKSR